MNPLFLYPVYNKILSYLDEYNKFVFCITLNIPYKNNFTNGILDCKGYKPNQFINLNLDNVNVYTLNWDACCRHRNFTINELVKYKKFVYMSQIKRFSSINIHTLRLLTHQIDD